MKRSTTSLKPDSEQVKAMIAAAPKRVDDPDCPYDPNDPKAVKAFWANAVVTKGSGYAAVRAALTKRRKFGQRGPGKRPPR